MLEQEHLTFSGVWEFFLSLWATINLLGPEAESGGPDLF